MRSLILLGALLTSCGIFTTDNHVVTIVENYGFSKVRVLSSNRVLVNLHGCKNSDAVAFKVEATNPNGKVVHFTACAEENTGMITLRF